MHRHPEGGAAHTAALLITLRGKPLAAVQPVRVRPAGKRLGALKGRMLIRRNLVRIDTTRDWEMLR